MDMPGAAPTPPPTPPPSPGAHPAPGPTGPATMAPNSGGMRMRGMIAVNPAMKMLERALSLMGSTSDEGQAVLKALTILAKQFGRASGDLERSEMKLAGASASPVSQPGPEMQSQIQQRLRAMGVGGAPSPGVAAAPAGASAGG